MGSSFRQELKERVLAMPGVQLADVRILEAICELQAGHHEWVFPGAHRLSEMTGLAERTIYRRRAVWRRHSVMEEGPHTALIKVTRKSDGATWIQPKGGRLPTSNGRPSAPGQATRFRLPKGDPTDTPKGDTQVTHRRRVTQLSGKGDTQVTLSELGRVTAGSSHQGPTGDKSPSGLQGRNGSSRRVRRPTLSEGDFVAPSVSESSALTRLFEPTQDESAKGPATRRVRSLAVDYARLKGG